MAKIKVNETKIHKYNIKLTEEEYKSLNKLLDGLSLIDIDTHVGDVGSEHICTLWYEMVKHAQNRTTLV